MQKDQAISGSFYEFFRKYVIRRDVSWSLILLTVSAICQFAGDFLLTKYLEAETIASYFNFRSFFLIFSSFVLLGNGTSIVREKELDKRFIFLCSSIQNFALSAITTSVYCFFFLKQPDYFIYYLVGLIIYSHSRIIFAIKQSEKKIKSSIYYSESWRIILLVAFLFIHYYIGDDITFLHLVLITILSFYSVLYNLIISFISALRSKLAGVFTKRNVKKLYGFGYLFFFFGLTLNASTYLDQLLVTTYIAPELSANYIAHITLFMSPLLFLNKFLTSFAAPYLRDDLEKIIRRIEGRRAILTFGFFSIMVLCYIASYFAFVFFFGEKYELQISISFFIWFTGMLRIMYILPSSIVGMRGSKSELNSFLFGNIIGLLVQLVISLVGIFYFGSAALVIVIIAMMLNWIIRLVSGFTNISRIMRR